MDGHLSGGGAVVDGIHLPPPDLADCLRNALVTGLPGGAYVLPAALHPLLLVILEGGIAVRRDGVAYPLPPLSVCGGTRGAREATAEPGTRILTVSLLPGGVRALFGVPGRALMEEAVDPARLLDRAGRGALARFVDARRPAGRAVSGMWELLREIRRGSDSPPALCVPPTLLDLSADALAERFGVGLRQFERRFLESYGQALRSYRRQLRCSRLLASLAGSDLTEGWAALAVREGYADQAHLCRDVRRFTGYAPRELQAGIARDDPAFWPYRVDPKILARHFGPTGF